MKLFITRTDNNDNGNTRIFTNKVTRQYKLS